MKNGNKDINSAELSRIVQQYEDMLRANTKVYFDEDDLLDIAEYYYYDMSKDADALRCLEYALKLHPESLPVRIRVAEIKFFQGHEDEARSLLKSIPEQNDPDVQYFYGLFALEEKNFDEAEEHYRKAYSLEQGDGVELFCNIVTDCLEHNALGTLEQWFNLLPDAYRDYPRVRELRSSYLQMVGRLSEAAVLVEKLIDNEPYNVVHWTNLTKLYIQMEQYGKARESNAYILDIEPKNHMAIALEAEIEFYSGNMERANELFDKYIALEDKDSSAYHNNAYCLFSMERLDDALQQLHYAHKFADEKDVDTRMRIPLLATVIYMLKDRIAEAKESLEESRSLGLDDEEYMHHSAMIKFREGKKAEADTLFDAVVEKYLARGEFPARVYQTYASLGGIDELLNALDRAVAGLMAKDCPTLFQGEFAAFYAFCYYDRADRFNFLQSLKTAAAKAPELTQELFCKIFPESLDVKDYYDYAETRAHK